MYSDDVTVVKGLINFMNKFHLINSGGVKDEMDEIQALVKTNSAKVMYFSDVKSYTTKIKNALAGVKK